MLIVAAFEGPYGGHYSMSSYGHCVLFAGSSGITYQLSYLRYLTAGCFARTVATRRITLIWVTRDIKHLSWIEPWLEEILRVPTGYALSIKVFITKAKGVLMDEQADARISLYGGRPNVQSLLDEEVDSQVGAMCVSVCGPGAFADDVREAAREVQDVAAIDFLKESFTW